MSSIPGLESPDHTPPPVGMGGRQYLPSETGQGVLHGRF